MDSGNLSKLTGRDLFNFRPELMLGDDDEADDIDYKREESDDEDEDTGEPRVKSTVKEINFDDLANAAVEVDTASQLTLAGAASTTLIVNGINGDHPTEDGAVGGSTADGVDAALAEAVASVDIDEALFDPDDLDDIDDELETLDIES